MRKPTRPEMRPEMRPPMRPLTDEDGEVRELTAEDFKHMRPLNEVDPGLIEAVAEYRRKRGRPKSPAPKIYIGLRMAPDVVESLKASGPGYNARVEQALRKAGFGAAKTKLAKKAAANLPGKELMTTVYIEARPKGRQEGSAIEGYVVVEQGDRVLKTFKTQAEAITWAKSKGHSPHVARVRPATPARRHA